MNRGSGGRHGIIASSRARAVPVVLVLLVAASCTRGLQEAGETLSSPSASSQTEPSGSVSATPSPMPGGGAARERIVLDRPQPDSEVLSPVLVEGTAVTASGRVSVRVLDAGGTELAAIVVDVTCGADCRGSFQAQLAFYVPSAQPGSVEVSAVTPPEPGGDGDLPLAEVPVTLIPGV